MSLLFNTLLMVTTGTHRRMSYPIKVPSIALDITNILVIILLGALVLLVLYGFIRSARDKAVQRERDRLIDEQLRGVRQKMRQTTERYIMQEKRKEELYGMLNLLNLEELTEVKATEEDYNTYLDIVTNRIQAKYSTYEFIKQNPDVETEVGWTLAFSVDVLEDKEYYDRLKRITLGKGLDVKKLNEHFLDRVKSGKVIELGNVIVQDDYTYITGLAEGTSFNVMITFTNETFLENIKEKKAKEKEAQDKQEAENKEHEQLQDNAYAVLASATTNLDSKLLENLLEEYPELAKAYEETKENLGYTYETE